MKTKFIKIRKFTYEFLLFIILTSISLSFFAPISQAQYEFESGDKGEIHQVLIAQTAGSGAAAETGATPGGGAQDTTGAGPGGGAKTPDGGTSTPTSTTPPAVSTPITPDKLFSTSGYEGLPQLDTSGTPVSMLNQFFNGIVQNIKYVLGAIAVLFIMLSGVKLIMAGDNEETVGRQKKAITYGIVGLAVIGFASELAKVFTVACPPGSTECLPGGFLSQPASILMSSGIFSRNVQIFITFIKYLIGGIAVTMLIRNGIRLIALQGKEESVTLDKKNIAFTSVGLILIIISSTLIDKVLFLVDTTKYPVGGVAPAINPERGMQEIVGITNIAVTFIAPLAVLVLIAGAIMYVTAGGKEEQMAKAKRMITLAIIGIALIYGAFAIISTIISGQFNA